MSKQSGLGDRFLIGGNDLSADIQALDKIGGGPALLDVTDITEEAHERLGGLRDGSMSFSEFFDSENAHPVLSALPTADEIMTYLRGTALANPAASLNAKQIGYDPDRGTDASLILKTEGQGTGYGLEWGEQLTPGVRADSEGTSGTAVDYGASSASGGQGYLQLTALTGTGVTVEIQHSADNSTWTTLLSFTEATAIGAQRVAVTGTVDRYLRVTTSGTFSAASLAVMFNRNQTATDF